MGIRAVDDDVDGNGLNTFSEDILKIEISGPEVRTPVSRPVH